MEMWEEAYYDADTVLNKDPHNLKALLIAAEASLKLGVSRGDSESAEMLVKAQKMLHQAKQIDNIQSEGRHQTFIQEQLRIIDCHMPYLRQMSSQLSMADVSDYLKSAISPGLFAEVTEMMEACKKHKFLEEIEDPTPLTCPISLELFKEPYIVSSGQTYERNFIQGHFHKNGNIDPMTRIKLADGLLIPNRAVQKACIHWQLQNKPTIN